MQDNSRRQSLQDKPILVDAPVPSTPSSDSSQVQSMENPQPLDQPLKSEEQPVVQPSQSNSGPPSPPPHRQSQVPPSQEYQRYPPADQSQYPNYQGPPSAGFHMPTPFGSQAQPNPYAYQQGTPPSSPTYPHGYQQLDPQLSGADNSPGYYPQGPPTPGPYSGQGYYQQVPPPPPPRPGLDQRYYQQQPPPTPPRRDFSQGYFQQGPYTSQPNYSQNQYGQHPKAFYDVYAIFDFLDATYAPKNTGVIEQSKVKAFMEGMGVHKNSNIGYLPPDKLEAFYAHFGIEFKKKLATPNVANTVNVASKVFQGASFFANVLGAGTGLGGGGDIIGAFGSAIGGSSKGALIIPSIDKDGLLALLSNTTKGDPNGIFTGINNLIKKHNLNLPVLERSQLPFVPDPMILEQYKSYEHLMQMKMQMKRKSTQMMANLMVQGAHNIEQASAPPGYYYTYN
ncbi:unnamed protein product [Umbelopsis ramanniana]